MKLKRKCSGFALSLLPCTMFLMTSPAQANLIGDTVNCAITGNILCSQASAVVGPAVEFTLGNPGGTQFFSVDFRASDVLFTVSASYGNNTSIFNFTDTTHGFASESLISTSGFFGTFGASNISLSGGTLMVNLTGTSANIGDTFDIGLNTATATPEPATTGLVGGGSMLLIAWMRKRRKG